MAPKDAFWEVTQVITDPEEDNDWVLECRIDFAASRIAVRPVIELLGFGT